MLMVTGTSSIERRIRRAEMAIAKISLPGGVQVEVDGTPDEVVAVLQQVNARNSSEPLVRGKAAGPAAIPKTLPECIISLRESEFFKEPKRAGEVHSELSMRY